jgi:molybdate transport system substrate-binding protein
LLGAAAVLGGCGGGGGNALVVSAAASLKSAFTRYGQQLKSPRPRFSFAGSDLLAAQIEQGVRPDVFASANVQLPDMLYARHLVARPVIFATNRLVLAVPAGSTRVRSLADLTKPGVTVAIGASTVPIGSYTRQVLARLGAPAAARIIAHVRTEEPDVAGIVGKLSQHAADAGFVYVTDVKASHGALRAIELLARLQPVVAYAAAVVQGAPHAAQARRFVAGLLSDPGRSDLRAAGFGAPPAPPGR